MKLKNESLTETCKERNERGKYLFRRELKIKGNRNVRKRDLRNGLESVYLDQLGENECRFTNCLN